MAYVPPEYPGEIPEFAEIWPAVDDVNWMYAAAWDAIVKELRAVQIELGTDPAGTFATVKARLDALLPHFHDRGDPGSWDFSEPVLTTNGAWHDLDLSSIVPAGAKAVLLLVVVKDDTIQNFLSFRKKGNANIIVTGAIYTQVANIYHSIDMVVACDTNRVIEYWATNVAWAEIWIAIKGWWK